MARVIRMGYDQCTEEEEKALTSRNMTLIT